MNQCHPSETPVCCCMDVGTVLDNTDCKASYRAYFADQQQAQSALESLTDKARTVESEPCQITSRVTPCEPGVQLDVEFMFACQAEAMIFQLGLR